MILFCKRPTTHYHDHKILQNKGAIGIDIGKREIVVFECKSLILAAGGYTRVYKVSSSRISENCGEIRK
jgi:succinate dehydrogenase/fumarate reductase flavoprotein subunit